MAISLSNILFSLIKKKFKVHIKLVPNILFSPIKKKFKVHIKLGPNILFSPIKKKFKVHIKFVHGLRILEINVLLETRQNVFFSLSTERDF